MLSKLLYVHTIQNQSRRALHYSKHIPAGRRPVNDEAGNDDVRLRITPLTVLRKQEQVLQRQRIAVTSLQNVEPHTDIDTWCGVHPVRVHTIICRVEIVIADSGIGVAVVVTGTHMRRLEPFTSEHRLAAVATGLHMIRGER